MKEIQEHQSVLLNESITALAIKADGVYIDATFGRGGHSKVILDQLGPNGRLLAMDKDPEAIAYAKAHFSHDKRFAIYHGSFAELKTFATQQGVDGKINGVLFDLGVSSPQLDDPTRGFSFLRSGQLDMRMDSSRGLDAAAWIAKVSEEELAQVLWEYGEERHSRRIARAIIHARNEAPITTTEQLAEIIKVAHPAWQIGKNPATQSFQAIRIFINNELGDLKEGLNQTLDILAPEGRIAVISFHSLEDRIVKHFMQNQERSDPYPARLPIKQSEFRSRLKRLGRAIMPSDDEVNHNPRARSAVLRVGEKLS